MTINLSAPTGWHDLSLKQMKSLFRLMVSGLDSVALRVALLLKWSGLKLVGKNDDGSWTFRLKDALFRISPLQIAEVLPLIDWVCIPPESPIPLPKFRFKTPLPANLDGVPFESFLILDNLYQGFLATSDDELLNDMVSVIYRHNGRAPQYLRTWIFFWFASLRRFFSRKFSDFYTPISNDAGLSRNSVEDAVNAQIRALSKGDITKEALILSLDTWRALHELNAQSREFAQLKKNHEKNLS